GRHDPLGGRSDGDAANPHGDTAQAAAADRRRGALRQRRARCRRRLAAARAGGVSVQLGRGAAKLPRAAATACDDQGFLERRIARPPRTGTDDRERAAPWRAAADAGGGVMKFRITVLCTAALIGIAWSQTSAPDKTLGGYIIEHDADVAKGEAGPHNGGGQTVGYSFFRTTPKLSLVFRKRIMKPGS